MLLMNGSTFVGVIFNAAQVVSTTDANSAVLAGMSRYQVINYALTTPGWKIIGVI